MNIGKSTVRKVDNVLLLIGVAVIAALWIAAAKPGKPVLTVWSCGSNYESISDFSKEFARKHNCRVRYTAAPVQYLLEYAMESDQGGPDVIVGRAGPGWSAIKQAGRLAKGPVFFAMDPYVIVTAPGNPKNILSLEDLGREGVRTVSSPRAMRPRGKCPAHLMSSVSAEFFPGLCERWENNCVDGLQCGRSLAKPVASGKADAAVVPVCMTSWPSVQGKVDVVPIDVKYLLAMKQCRATMPQCCGILSTSRNRALAEEFVREMTNEEGSQLFERHGYFPINSKGGRELKELIQVFKPQDMAGWQVHMALGLYGDGAYTTALRRFFTVINTFGPSQYDAQARYWAGNCLEALGNKEAACLQWTRVVREFPRNSKNEWESKVLHVGKPVPGVEQLPESYWVEKARNGLRRVQSSGKTFSDQHYLFLNDFKLTHEPVMEGDPDKNGTRNLQVGKDLLKAGQYESASRDLLKVVTLNYPSKHGREARFWLGVASCLRGLYGLAANDWTELSDGTDRWAVAAKKAITMVEKYPKEKPYSAKISMPKWRPSYNTHVERGMSYGMLLWEHHMPISCFKEMDKILFGEYQAPGKLAPEARYRMGVCCAKLDKPESAFNQWALLKLCYPSAQKWASAADKSQKMLPEEYHVLQPFVSKLETGAQIDQFKKIPKSSFGKRYKGAEELFNAGIFESNQCLLEYWKVMTVTDPSQEKNRQIRPMAEYKAGVCCLKSGQKLAARKHFENVIDKYPGDKAAKLASAALRKADR